MLLRLSCYLKIALFTVAIFLFNLLSGFFFFRGLIPLRRNIEPSVRLGPRGAACSACCGVEVDAGTLLAAGAVEAWTRGLRPSVLDARARALRAPGSAVAKSA